jgi:hypothetical protein
MMKHSFIGCGKTHERIRYRGRAALQGRVKAEITSALAIKESDHWA